MNQSIDRISLVTATTQKQVREVDERREHRIHCAMYFIASFIMPPLIKATLEYSNRNLATHFITDGFSLLLIESAFVGGWAVAAYLRLRGRKIPQATELGFFLTAGAFLGTGLFDSLLNWGLK